MNDETHNPEAIERLLAKYRFAPPPPPLQARIAALSQSERVPCALKAALALTIAALLIVMAAAGFRDTPAPARIARALGMPPQPLSIGAMAEWGDTACGAPATLFEKRGDCK